MPTPEQRAANAALREAVDQVARAYSLVPDDSTIVDFVTVIEALRIQPDDEDGCNDEFRALLFREGVARTSVAIGLLDHGKHMLYDDLRNNSQES